MNIKSGFDTDGLTNMNFQQKRAFNNWLRNDSAVYDMYTSMSILW